MANPPSRQVFPDRLRGIALLGIVAVNAPPLGISVDGFTAASLEGPVNAVTAFIVIAFAQGKFYLLFSFLFGYSAAFILRQGKPARPSAIPTSPRGSGRHRFIHAVFFYIGDILMTYAVLGGPACIVTVFGQGPSVGGGYCPGRRGAVAFRVARPTGRT